MRQASRRPAVLILLAMVASLLGVITPTAAQAAESIPVLQWSPVHIGDNLPAIVSGPSGSTTVGCENESSNDSRNNDLQTLNASGQVVQDISRTGTIDGVSNCIWAPAVDKNGAVYGFPYGKTSSGSWATGANLLAYDGNTLKWKYPANCGSSGYPPVVGADGNVYTLNRLSNGQTHLIGLSPDVASGQTQPTQVLDAVVAGNCSTQLSAYKDGIMLHGSNTGGVRFYSYAGTSVAQVSVGTEEKINADGKLFYPSFMTTTNGRSGSVEMFNPSTGQVQWTAAVSTSGANVNDLSVYPLPGGGVVALVQEQKMQTGGIPASPTEWVYTIATINSAGLKVSSVTLPNTGANITYGNTRVSADTSGSLAVMRAVSQTVTTATGSTRVVPAVSLAVYNPANNTWSNQTLMTGDALKSGGPNGYNLNDGPYLTNNTLLFRASCSGNCTDTAARLYAAQVTGLGMDYPRGDVLSRTARPSASYVALGDSFSAGEGVPPFETATDIPGVNTCHRSTNAYARLIAGTSSKIPSLGTGGFRACSGAVTTNITDLEQWNEDIQLDWWPDSTTQLVTLTIGGNDIAFSDFAKACVYPTSSCDFGTAAYNTSLDKINNELPAKLETTYKRILAYAPNAKIYVLGYPQVIANKSVSDPADSRCFYMQGGSSNWSEARAARDIVTKLNAKISTAVTNVRALNTSNTRLTYVPMDAAGSPFIGHEVCGTDSTSWFQNIDQATGDPAYVFHPNSFGQQGYATVAAAAINAG